MFEGTDGLVDEHEETGMDYLDKLNKSAAFMHGSSDEDEDEDEVPDQILDVKEKGDIIPSSLMDELTRSNSEALEYNFMVEEEDTAGLSMNVLKESMVSVEE